LSMRAWFRYFTPGDIILILLMCVFAGVLSFYLPSRFATSGNVVFISCGSRLVGRYALNHDRVITVKGPLGETKVQIDGGKVRILSSPCPNHYCVRMGDISAGGATLLCVPNQVVVRVGGNESQRLDAISR
jgi:hypothetical protein